MSFFVVHTNFFDDCVLMSEQVLRESTSKAFEGLLDLLGWSFDRDGPKLTSFGRSVNALGITLDFSESDRFC